MAHPSPSVSRARVPDLPGPQGIHTIPSSHHCCLGFIPGALSCSPAPSALWVPEAQAGCRRREGSPRLVSSSRWHCRRAGVCTGGLGGREAGREPEVGLLVYLNPFLCDAKSSQCFRESNILLRTKQNLIQTHEDRGFPVVHTVKNLPAVQETGVPSLGWEDPLEKGMAIHSSILAWDIPWTEKPGRLQFVGAQSQTRLSD